MEEMCTAKEAHSLRVCQMSPCESVKSAQKLEVSGMEEDGSSAGDSPSALSCPCYVEYEICSQTLSGPPKTGGCVVYSRS